MSNRDDIAEAVREIWSATVGGEDWLAVADYILKRDREAFYKGYSRAVSDASRVWETVP